MRTLNTLSALRYQRNCSSKSTDFVPKAKYNPFAGGIQFPSVYGISSKNPVSHEAPQNKNGDSKVQLNAVTWTPSYIKRNAHVDKSKWPKKPQASDLDTDVGDLLVRDNIVIRAEAEAGARLAVRKLMTLHFHAERHRKVEADINKQEEETILARYLTDRQKAKESNAMSLVIAGESPVPTARGIVPGLMSYKSLMSSRNGKRKVISSQPGRGGSFVVTPESTSKLLAEKVDDAEDETETWIEKIGLGGGRSIDDILKQHNLIKDDGLGNAKPIEEEWGDANESTFAMDGDKPVPDADEENGKEGDERLSERKINSKKSFSSKIKKSQR